MKNKKEMILLNKTKSIVTTWDNREVPLENCKKILGKYYEMGVDCFYVQSETGNYKWYRLNTGKIAFNVDANKYELVGKLQENENLIRGIYNEKGEQGFFINNPYTTIVLNNSSDLIPCYSREIALKLGYQEDFKSGLFYRFDKPYVPVKGIYKYKGINKLSYNADNNNNLFLKVMRDYAVNKKFISLSDNTEKASKIFPYTFGIELESCNGTISKDLLGPLGIVPLKDGSLRKEDGTEPYEYTTIPLEGAIGLETVKLICNELSHKCEFDEKCSMHLHLGNLKKRTPEFVIAFYKLCFNLQDEIFEMFPAYKTEPEKYVKNFHKNYCSKLPDLGLNSYNFKNTNSIESAKKLTKQAFDAIYRAASDNTIQETNDEWNLNNTNHPKGSLDKWNYLFRYHWVNFISYLFNPRTTLEFRVHTPTFNFTKVSNWMYICAGLVQYAEQFTNEILRDEVPYTLNSVLSCYTNNFFKSFYDSDYNRDVGRYLIDYVEHRKEQMRISFEKKDYYGKTTIEFKKDLDFTFDNGTLNSVY